MVLRVKFDYIGTSKKITLLAVPSLRVLALEYAAKIICKDDPRLQPGQYPDILREAIEAERSNQ